MLNTIISKGSRTVVSVQEDLLVVLTPDNRIRYANTAFLIMLMKNKQDVIGADFAYCFPRKGSIFENFTKQITQNEPKAGLLQKHNILGNLTWLYWTANGNFDNDGILSEIFVSGKDVSASMLKDKKERDAVILLKAFKDAIETNVICSITDIDGKITYANSHFCHISQYSLDELVGRTHKIINSGYHSNEFYDDMWQKILAGKTWEGEIRNRAKDNSIYWVKAIIIPILDIGGKISSFLSLRIPITEQKQHEEAKVNQMRNLENLLFMVSHELRRPITTLMGVLFLLQESMPENDEYMELINCMLTSTDELDMYSRKMNDFLQTIRSQELELKLVN